MQSTRLVSRTALFAAPLLAGPLLLAALAPSPASAQSDLADVRPVVIIALDTSGSMEYQSGSGAAEVLPECAGNTAGANEQNRWMVTLQALTGTWPAEDYYCTEMPRSAYPGSPDSTYRLPHFAPPTDVAQSPDGIFDIYRDLVRFGLMTFDNVAGLTDIGAEGREYVDQPIFLARQADSQGALGDYSYGEPRPFTFPGCGTTYMVDSGIRNASALAGALVSVGSDGDDYRIINDEIQDQLINIRPYGGTPTDAMLEDLAYYLSHHPDVAPGAAGEGDPFALCRQRFAIVMSDGVPDTFYQRLGCGAPGTVCPYQPSAETAAELCVYDGDECTGALDGLFVVALSPEAADIPLLDDIADRGGTGSAYIASDTATLISSLSAVLSRAAAGTRTRTPVAVGQSGPGVSPRVQYYLHSGFNPGSTAVPEWSGVLERVRYQCDADLTPVAQEIDPSQGDSFHETLDARDLSGNPRRLLTVLTSRTRDMTGTILGEGDAIAPLGGGGGGSTVTGATLTEFSSANSDLTAAHLGITGASAAARRDATIRWVHGETRTHRLADIYHSAPTVVGPPTSDIADESYNLWRRQPEVATRPTVVYVGTNDGILHAFALEDWRAADGGATLAAGEELWGFIPPAVVGRLEAASQGHQLLLDGSPVVQDVFFMRTPGQTPSADLYHTVLLMGLRGGGNSYFALDVTDPLEPVFLWQYSSTNMGLTYARPAIGQVLVEVSGTLQERAMVLLPGGDGTIDVEGARTTGPIGCPAQGVGQPPVTQGTLNARSRQRCWGRTGRDLAFVDGATGEELALFDYRTFNAPLTGAVSFFSGETGTIATRAYLTDADGIVWRLDFASPQIRDWEAAPFHDIFWDAEALGGRPAYDKPVLTTDENGDVVIILGTGDVDRLDSNDSHRIVSLTDHTTFNSDGTTDFVGELNWEIRMPAGEQLTGAIQLIDGTAYFGTYDSQATAGDLCPTGISHMWGVDYLASGAARPSGYQGTPFPAYRMESVEGSGTFDVPFVDVDGLMLGVTIVQQSVCTAVEDSFDPYLPHRLVTEQGGGGFQVVAQLSQRTGATAAGAPQVSSVSRTIPRPQGIARFTAYVPTADY